MKTCTASLAMLVVAGVAPQLMAQADTASALTCAAAARPRVSIGESEKEVSSATLDTTIVLNIADRSFTRDALAAGVAFGASGTAGSRSEPWRVCTGASTSLGRVSASLRGVYGQVHLRIDPSALRALVNPTAAPARK